MNGALKPVSTMNSRNGRMPMLRCYMLFVFGLLNLTCQSPLYGQASAQRPEFPREGKTVLKLTPVNPGGSLEQLVLGSELIVDGTVSYTQQPISRSVSTRQVIVETHAVVSVNAVLKGALPKGSSSILVAQVGGRSGGWETEVERDVLLAAGTRYLLFLQNDDNRSEVANNTGMRRYGIVGLWSGKVIIVDGKVRFLPGVSSELEKYNGWDLFSVSQEVKDLAAGRYVPRKGKPGSPLPPHPGPPSGRRQ